MSVANTRLRSSDSQSIGEAGVIPVMAIFLTGHVLLSRDDFAGQSAIQRAVPHGELPGVAALKVSLRSAHSFGRRQGPALDGRKVFFGSSRPVAHLPSHAHWRSAAVSPPHPG